MKAFTFQFHVYRLTSSTNEDLLKFSLNTILKTNYNNKKESTEKYPVQTGKNLKWKTLEVNFIYIFYTKW